MLIENSLYQVNPTCLLSTPPLAKDNFGLSMHLAPGKFWALKSVMKSHLKWKMKRIPILEMKVSPGEECVPLL